MQLENVTSGAVVAVDVESRDPRPAENACAVSASLHVDACARNTFTFEPYVPRTAKAAAMLPTYDDDVLHYGQKVKLAVNPRASRIRLGRRDVSPQVLHRVADALRQVFEAVRGGGERQRLVRVRVRGADAGPGEELVSEGAFR